MCFSLFFSSALPLLVVPPSIEIVLEAGEEGEEEEGEHYNTYETRTIEWPCRFLSHQAVQISFSTHDDQSLNYKLHLNYAWQDK